MIREVEIKISPQEASDENLWKPAALQAAGLHADFKGTIRLLRRSIDSRGRSPQIVLRIAIFDAEDAVSEPSYLPAFQVVADCPEVIIIGAGPAGYFAALECLVSGLKPVLLERGKDVRSRRRDLKAIQQFGLVDENSNYCFGEGGAGTYSDGKLYTRSNKRGDINKILKLLVEHGANSEILIDAHPHIGSNKLPQVIANIRSTIQHYGGEVHFDSRVVDFIMENKILRGVLTHNNRTFLSENVILATGHSARDIYYLMQRHQISMESKSFALGVRAEHPQALIDSIQYKQKARDPYLPPSSYSLVCQVNHHGVFSFCMCPGGLIIPAATAPGEIVVNGMSLSKRDSPFANSGIVMTIDPSKLMKFKHFGVFAGLEFQKEVEQKVFAAGDGSQKAPAVRMTDFVHKKLSADLPGTSYIPGLLAAPLYDILPGFVYQHLQKAFIRFGSTMKGYYTEEANIVATESRTSSPVRIPRDSQTLEHPEVKGLYPCGEGAGYAGGIVSAAMDGQKVVQAIVNKLFHQS